MKAATESQGKSFSLLPQSSVGIMDLPSIYVLSHLGRSINIFGRYPFLPAQKSGSLGVRAMVTYYVFRVPFLQV
jgi:hypothetical protein